MASNDYLDRDEKVRLIDDLLQMTRSGAVRWSDLYEMSSDAVKRDDKDSRRAAVFVTRLPNFAFLLSSVDRDGVAPFEVEVYRLPIEPQDQQSSIFSIRMTPRDEEGDEEINIRLLELYTDVFRRVRRPDEVIRELFDEIAQAKAKKEPPF